VGYLFWPGDHRADDHFSDQTFREAMLAVEMVWLDVLVEAGIAPPDARADLSGMVEDFHEEWLVEETEAGGNPAMALVDAGPSKTKRSNGPASALRLLCGFGPSNLSQPYAQCG